MKKSVLAASVIGALAAAWLGGTWYSGKMLQAQYATQIEEINKTIGFYLPPSGEVTIRYQNISYQRGFFSAEIQDKLVLSDKDGQKEMLLDSTIQHGPLPLANLAKFNLTPVLATGSAKLGENAWVKPWFELSKGQNPLTADFSIGYHDRIVSQIRIAALEYLKDNIMFNMSEVVIDSDTNLQGIGDVKLNWDRLSFTEKADNENSFENRTLRVDGITLDSALQPTPWQDLAVGTQTLAIKAMALDIQLTEQSDSYAEPIDIKLHELVLTGESKLSDGFFDVLFQFNLDKILLLNKHDLGKLYFDVALKHVDGQALNDLTDAFNAPPVDGQMAPAQYEKAQSAVSTLLEKTPELQFSPLAWRNSGGISRLNLDLGIHFPKTDDTDEITTSALLQYLSKFDFNAEIDKKMLQQLLTQIASIRNEMEQNGLPPEQAAQEADESYRDLLQQLAESGLFIETPDAFSAKAWLENGQLTYNGEVVAQETLDQAVLTALFVFAQAFYSDSDDEYYDSLYDESDGEAAAFGEEDGELFLPSDEYDLSIPDLSPSDLEGLPPVIPQHMPQHIPQQ
ncbi:Uncharacterized conserved protein YdgA, DUF945 family [Pasteurella testudinis DSM 23072]|uniref:Uncharacterized conserved protein YdgA, DUF945 family n=1 Tax=Pasteurella testudinis DSM 23072 TaxID=1122938 RepID=A0A1W1UM72_9PAST|nr:YdgA family protein [Pasteurella testudinis]SMB82196.1 Uncharacterized conserved protein YdgA, DUF945 family [Pasteurella testudinis DSM 23072]SUB52344.1 putative GTP-binding protein [Pasteurella testudinis]